MTTAEGPGRESSMAERDGRYEAMFAQRPLILVSNRGPVEHQVTQGGRPEARRGSGGVVTAYSSLAQSVEFTWVASAMGEGDRVVSNNGLGPHLKSPLPGHKINLRYVVSHVHCLLGSSSEGTQGNLKDLGGGFGQLHFV